MLFEVPAVELAAASRVATAAMCDAFALEMPLRVKLEAGPTWADLEPLLAPAAGPSHPRTL